MWREGDIGRDGRSLLRGWSMETIIEIFSKSIEIPVFPLRIKNNIKLIPKLFPKLDFKILVSSYTFGLSHWQGRGRYHRHGSLWHGHGDGVAGGPGHVALRVTEAGGRGCDGPITAP